MSASNNKSPIPKNKSRASNNTPDNTRWTRGAGPAVGITVSAQFSGIILWLKCSMIFSSIFFWFLEISIFFRKIPRFFSTKLFTHLQNALRVTPRVLISWQTMFLSIENVSGVPDGPSFPPVGTAAAGFQNKRSAWHHRFWDIALTENRPKAGINHFGKRGR